MSAPTSLAINDAIGFLAALSDVNKTSDILKELKKHADDASSALEQAQAAQKDADIKNNLLKNKSEEIEKQRISLQEDRANFIKQSTAYEDNNKKFVADLYQKTQDVEAKERALKERLQLLLVREKEVYAYEEKHLKMKQDMEDERERLDEIIETIRPIADKLKIKV